MITLAAVLLLLLLHLLLLLLLLLPLQLPLLLLLYMAWHLSCCCWVLSHLSLLVPSFCSHIQIAQLYTLFHLRSVA
jgi:hypothetical protein